MILLFYLIVILCLRGILKISDEYPYEILGHKIIHPYLM